MAVITGTPGNDTRVGSNGADTISTGNGNDRIFALQGNDSAFGGNGNDTAYGGDGRDWLYGQNGRDSLWGDAAGDRLDGGNDADYLNGGTGIDTAWGGAGNDQLWGGDDDDSVFGGAGNDLVGGGSGDDLLQGGAGNDSLRGLDGTDTAVFAGYRDGYSIVRDGETVIVTDTDTTDGNDGTDRLGGVERLRFLDRTVSLDGLDLDGWFSGFPLGGEIRNSGAVINQGGAQGGVEGDFAEGPVAISETETFNDVALGDLDGDGDLDVALAVGSSVDEDGSLWLPNLGGAQGGDEGTFTEGVSFGDTTDAAAIALGDLDNDGDLDVVLAGGFDEAEAPALAINQGGLQEGNEGDFVTGSLGDFDAGTSLDVALGDIDNDGDLDVVGAIFLGALVWARNLTIDGSSPETLAFETAFIETGGPALTVALGDLDGDGTLDAFVGGNFTDELENLTGAAVIFDFGTDSEPEIAPVAGLPLLIDAAIGDVDGDGDLDVVGTSIAEEQPQLLTNQGGAQEGTEGEFVAADLDSDGLGVFGVALGDLDADGDLDILSSTDEGIVAWFNQGGLQGGSEGAFLISEDAVSSEDWTAIRLALGDIDGDGSDSITEAGLPFLGDGLPYANDPGLFA